MSCTSRSGRRTRGASGPSAGAIAAAVFAALLISAAPAPTATSKGIASSSEWFWPPSDAVALRVEENLSLHFEGDALRTYIEAAGDVHRDAAEFLLAWMPSSDLGSLSAELFIKNVDLAVEAWQTASWGNEIDPYTFHTYVLPHRVSQEPVEDWRGRLRGLGLPRVEGLTMSEAALAVGRMTREWATYRASSRRDQGPLTTMERGLGRCEEDMILTICALRSVGIPARSCSTPWWTTVDSNHAWVEVYVGSEEGWHYMESCDASACLDRTWFTERAKRTGVVLSVGYGEAPVPGELAVAVQSMNEGAVILNSTDVYTTAGTLIVADPRKDAQPRVALGGSDVTEHSLETSGGSDEPRAHIHIYNYGGPTPLLSSAFGDGVRLGPGDYIVTTEIDGEPWSAFATVIGGETTTATLAPGLDLFDSPIWMRYPPQPESEPRNCDIDRDDASWLTHQNEVARRDLERCRRSMLTSDWVVLVADRPDARALTDALIDCGPVAGEWSEAVTALPIERQGLALDVIAQMDVKDFYEFDSTTLPQVLDSIEAARERIAEYPDTLWTRFVISPRLYFQRGSMAWWLELPIVTETDTPLPAMTEAALNAFREHVVEAERTRFGHVATPEETWRSGVADVPAAKACLVGLLRRQGIPAKAELGVDYIDAWDGSDWSRLEPFRTEGVEAETVAAVGDEAYIVVSYYDEGVPIENVQTWIHSRLNRFRDGRFATWYLGQLSEGDGRVEWTLPADEYWLFGGLRNPRGEPRFVTKRFEVSPGESLAFDLDIGIPLEEWDAADLVQGGWDPDAMVTARHGRMEQPLLDVIGDGRRLVVLTITGHEASVGHLAALRSIDWTASGLNLTVVQLAGLPDHPADEGAVTITAEDAQEYFGISNPVGQLPLTILLNETGETKLWLRGMRRDMADQIARTLRE